jgi:hypothetical protein
VKAARFFERVGNRARRNLGSAFQNGALAGETRDFPSLPLVSSGGPSFALPIPLKPLDGRLPSADDLYMSVLHFAPVPESDVPSPSPESAEANRRDSAPSEATVRLKPDIAPATDVTKPDVGQQLIDLQAQLEHAAVKCANLQQGLATQQQLEQLLRQGRTHLHDLRARLQQTTAERNQLATELNERKTAYLRELDRLETQLQEATAQGLLQRTRAEQLDGDLQSKEQERRQQVDGLRNEIQQMTAERDRLGTDLAEREATQKELAARLAEREGAYKQLTAEREEEQYKFETAIAAAANRQKDIEHQVEDQREEIRHLRETSMRAQALAREIMQAHEMDRSGKRD